MTGLVGVLLGAPLCGPEHPLDWDVEECGGSNTWGLAALRVPAERVQLLLDALHAVSAAPVRSNALAGCACFAWCCGRRVAMHQCA